MLNTFLITFNFPTILSSIRMLVHMSQIQYNALSVRNSDMVKASVKGNLNVLSVQRKTMRASIVITNEVLQLWSTSHGFIERLSIFPERKRDPKNQKIIYHTLRCAHLFLPRMIHLCKIICQCR
jgi:hypothetical protein